MECELNGRWVKLEENGDIYWWFDENFNRHYKIKNPYWKKCKQGTHIDKKGKKYKRITLNGRRLFVHRVIYYIHNQEWNIWDTSKANLIDHIDRNTFNNNIENLRVVTNQFFPYYNGNIKKIALD